MAIFAKQAPPYLIASPIREASLALTNSEPLLSCEFGCARMTPPGSDAGAGHAPRRGAAAEPELGSPDRALGDRLFAAGDTQGADAAYSRYFMTPIVDPVLAAAARAVSRHGLLEQADSALRDRLRGDPNDPLVLAILAEVQRLLGQLGEAEPLFVRCLERHPSCENAKIGLALTLISLTREAEALSLLEPLAASRPRSRPIQVALASCLAGLGEQGRAIAILQAEIAAGPSDADLWIRYGLALKSVARTDEAIAAIRRAIALTPDSGEAWYRLAELKTVPFAAGDGLLLRAALGRSTTDARNRADLYLRPCQGARGRGRHRGRLRALC